MSHEGYVALAWSIVVLAMSWVLFWSWLKMRRAEKMLRSLVNNEKALKKDKYS